MAINTANNNQNNQPAVPDTAMAAALEKAKVTGTAAGVAPEFYETQPQPADQQLTWTNHGGLSLFRWGNTHLSAGVAKLDEKFKEMAKAITENPAFPGAVTTFIIDNQTSAGLKYSVAVVALEYTGGQKRALSYFSYLLAGTSDKIPVRREKIENEEVVIESLPSDAYDNVLRKVVAAEVAARFQVADKLEASAAVVPTFFNFEDEMPVRELFNNALRACMTHLDFFLNPRDMTVQELTAQSNGSRLYVNVEAGTEQAIFDEVGLPVRSDIIITTSSRSREDQRQTSLNAQSSAELSKIAGYVDLMWAAESRTMHNQFLPQMQQPTKIDPLYAPVFVITHARTQQLHSLPSQLFMLASTSILVEDNRWTFTFMPDRNRNPAHAALRDLSVIGLDLNLTGNADGVGDPLPDVTPETMNIGRTHQLMMGVCKPHLYVAIDVPECGAYTWAQSFIAAAADGDAKAIQDVFLAANTLTGNLFASNYKGTGRPFTRIGGRLVGGYIRGTDGKMYDPRTIDYLAILSTFGKTDMNQVRRWSTSFTNEAKNPVLRAHYRRSIMSEFGQEGVTYVQRVVIEPEFLRALTAAIQQGKVTITPELPWIDQNSTNIRQAAPFLAIYQPVAHTASGLFQYGPVGGSNNVFSGHNTVYNYQNVAYSAGAGIRS